MSDSLKVFSMFSSIQGESTRSGLPCSFVRVAGCPLHCVYCDTPEARAAAGTEMSVRQVVAGVEKLGQRMVEVTGGEPLAQSATPLLLRTLCDQGLEVLLETSGAFSIEQVDPRVRVIMDVKCPGSGMSHRICKDNFDLLDPDRHELKFVLMSRSDFEWAISLIRDSGLVGRAELLISPVLPGLRLPDVADWILSAELPLRLHLQLHKFIWRNPGVNQ